MLHVAQEPDHFLPLNAQNSQIRTQIPCLNTKHLFVPRQEKRARHLSSVQAAQRQFFQSRAQPAVTAVLRNALIQIDRTFKLAAWRLRSLLYTVLQ